MRRPRVPAFIAELFAEPVARNGLFAGSAALFAAALDPKVWGPALPSVQAAIRERPELEAVILLAALGGSALLLLGGAIGDSARARPIIVGGLAIELLASVVGLLVPTGTLFIATRFVGHAAAAFVIPASLALVATSYTGIARATAIGLAYGAYGAAGAAAPILLQLVPDNRAPAFLAAIAACGLGALARAGQDRRAAAAVGPGAQVRRRDGDLGVRSHRADGRRDLDRRDLGQHAPMGDHPRRDRGACPGGWPTIGGGRGRRPARSGSSVGRWRSP